MLLDVCDNLSILGVLLFIKNLLKVICIVVPILLLLFLTIDFTKATIENDQDKMNKVKSVAIKRIVYAILVFLIPAIVNGVMGLLGDTTKFSSCYDLATSSKVQRLADEADAKRKAEAAENEAHRKLLEEEAQKYAALLEQAINEQGSSNTSATQGIYNKNNISGSSAIAITAEALAYPYGTSKSVYKHNYSNGKCFSSWSALTGAKPTKAFMNAFDSAFPNHFKGNCKNGVNIGTNCTTSISVILKYSGYDTGVGISLKKSHFANNKKWKKVSSAQKGDVCYVKRGNTNDHPMIYLGNNRVADSGLPSKRFYQIRKDNCNKAHTIYRATN